MIIETEMGDVNMRRQSYSKSEREELVDQIAQHIVDDLDVGDLISMAKETIKGNLLALPDQEIWQEGCDRDLWK